MMAVFAEFENDIRSERIISGMQKAGKKGRKINFHHISQHSYKSFPASELFE
jgi:DNA invertase Pin-like site-specific DNA recombinase